MSAGAAPLEAVYAQVEAYYAAKVARHGATPPGVDWSCRATQELRFVQLLKVCDFAAPFALNDLGCGYGALVAYLAWRHPDAAVDYLGIDLTPAMVRRARRRHAARGARFAVGRRLPRVADYTVASGIMNVKLDQPRNVWEAFVAVTLREMRRASRRGFAVNFMAAAPQGSSPEGLYRTAPEPWVRFCESELGCGVQVLREYGLREFTLLARLAAVA